MRKKNFCSPLGMTGLVLVVQVGFGEEAGADSSGKTCNLGQLLLPAKMDQYPNIYFNNQYGSSSAYWMEISLQLLKQTSSCSFHLTGFGIGRK